MLLVDNMPSSFSDFVIHLWRGPLSFLRHAFENKRYKKNIDPYFKLIEYKNLKIEMYVDVKESWVGREVDLRGIHEEHILEKIIDNLTTGSVFVDVGANMGHHALFASKKVGETGKVFAFEPVPSTAECIRKSREKNTFSNLEVIQKALGNKTEMVRFFTYGYSDISGKNLNFTDREAKEIQVDQSTLDIELLEKRNTQSCDLIKIDVEGYELDVLHGAEKVIERFHPKIILEFSPVFYDKLNPEDSFKILELLKSKSYALYDIDTLFGQITDIEDYIKKLKTKGNISNILCV